MTSKPRRTKAPRGQTHLAGRATADGTARLAARFADRFAPSFYRALGATGTSVSSIGFGTYLGACDSADDDAYADSACHALASGINLLDTAINYRCQRSERTLGQALARAVQGGTVARDEVVVCTKGGYIPLDGTAPPTREAYQAYLEREYYRPGIMAPAEVVAGGHCLAPAYLASQIERSRKNLSLETIDVYYIHNPEQQLEAIPRPQLADRLRSAFAMLEERCASGEIGAYGCATWNGFRVPPTERGHLELADVVALAREVGGDGHHFRAIQLPVNLAFTEAVRTPTQRLSGRAVTLLEAASELGVAVIASAPLLQSKLATNLPPQLRDTIPGYSTDAQRAIAFVRSLPVITSALVGMKSRGHLRENLEAGFRRQEG